MKGYCAADIVEHCRWEVVAAYRKATGMQNG